jgi:hypothetical protein
MMCNVYINYFQEREREKKTKSNNLGKKLRARQDSHSLLFILLCNNLCVNIRTQQKQQQNKKKEENLICILFFVLYNK